MHALSLGTWWIHITSVLEWIAAIVLIQRHGRLRREGGWRWLALAMLPALASAMAACTWHLYDNSDALRGLVVLQAGLTGAGNLTLAIAAWNLLRRQRLGLDHPAVPEPGPARHGVADPTMVQGMAPQDKHTRPSLEPPASSASTPPAGARPSPRGPMPRLAVAVGAAMLVLRREP